jgi:hypothetical protein
MNYEPKNRRISVVDVMESSHGDAGSELANKALGPQRMCK